MSIIGVCGAIGSGKDTMADIFQGHAGYKKESFAKVVKDVCSSIFGWPRHMLEGNTIGSRIYRDQVDEFWAEKLGIPNFSPRYALQHIGTNVLRHHFHNDIWIFALEKKLRSLIDENQDVVISDVRFPNEIKMIKEKGGYIIRLIRGDLPEWHNMAVKACQGCDHSRHALEEMGIHQSEYAIADQQEDFTIYNNGTIADLVKEAMEIETYLKLGTR